MHLQQTKFGSRKSGGPQYYFHDLSEPVKQYLRHRGVCPVVLQTPYGIAASPFVAVGRDHKLGPGGRPLTGRVGHDRIQQASGTQSIGEAIRYWYNLQNGDFETIELDVELHPDGHFILIPTAVLMRHRKRRQELERVSNPLSFHPDHQSKLWRKQIEAMRSQSRENVAWAATQLAQVVSDHSRTEAKHVLESDLLRAAGALSILGLRLSPYLGNGYDCAESTAKFLQYPTYRCPVEIKKRSKGFTYQVTKYIKLPRAVVLCMNHTLVNSPGHIDVIEMRTLATYLGAL